MKFQDKSNSGNSNEVFDELEYSSMKENRIKKFSSLMNKTEVLLTLMGVGLFILILLFIIFIPSAQKTTDNKQLESIDARLKAMEDRLINIEWADKKFERFNGSGQNMDDLISKYNKLEAAVLSKIDLLETKIETLEQKSRSTLARKTPAPKKKPAANNPPKVSQKKATKRYHQIRHGETLYSISRRYGITVDGLCGLNNFKKGKSIYPGQKLIISAAN